MIPRDLTFAHPKAAFLLLALPLFLLLYLLLVKGRAAALEKLASWKVLTEIAVLRSPFFSKLKFSLFCLAWFFACLALMEPIGNMHFREGKRAGSTVPPQNVLFLLDTSESMAVKDTPGNFSRLSYAKEIIDQIARRLPGSNVMLTTFTSGDYPAVPLTMDNVFFRLRLKEVGLNEGEGTPGTDFLKALSELKSVYNVDPSKAYQSLILLSDGEDLENPQDVQKIASLVAPKSFPHLKVYAIGVGSTEGGEVPGVIYQGKPVISQLEESLLKAIAKAGEGRYFSSNQYTPEDLAKEIVGLIKERDQKIESGGVLSDQSLENVQNLAYDEYFQIPLFLSLLSLLLALFLPETLRGANKLSLIVALFIPLSAESQEDSFAAKQAYEAKDYPLAASIYEALLDKSSSLPKRALLKYNLGTVLEAQGKDEEAIQELQDAAIISKDSHVRLQALFNLGLAYYHQALLDKDSASQIYAITQALQQMELAEKASCFGAQGCAPPFEIKEAKLRYKEKLTEVESAVPQDLSPLNPLTEWTMLLNSINQGITYLESEALPVNLKNSYFNFYSQMLEKGTAFWNSLSTFNKGKDASLLLQEGMSLFEEGKKAFKLKKWEESSKAFEKAQEKVQGFFDFYYNPGKKEQLVMELKKLYMQAQNSEAPSPFDALRLSYLQKRALQLFPLSEEMKAAEADLNKSLASLDSGDFFGARPYLTKALLEVRKSQLSLNPQSPRNDLEKLITEAEASISLERLFLEKDGEVEKSFNKMKVVQGNQVTQLAKAFPKNAIEWQKKRFKEGKCQCRPWDKVFPIFLKAELYWLKGMQQSSKAPLAELDAHKAAVKLWKQALLLLKSTPEEPPSNEESQNVTVEELEEMQSQDKIPVMRKPLPEGGKTW